MTPCWWIFLITSYIPLLSSALNGEVWQDFMVHSLIHCQVFTGYCCVSGFILSMPGAALKIDKAPQSDRAYTGVLGTALTTVHTPPTQPHSLPQFPHCRCLIPVQDFTVT